jgi:hypothetical protein
MRPDSGSRVKLVSELQHRYDQLGQEIMKYTTVKISEILQHPTKRLDAGYWIKKKKKRKKLQATSSKLDSD